MTLQFWGVRGSVPTPLTPQAVKAKISSVLQRLKAADLVSAESRERFLAGLPPDLFGHVGGNTTCVEILGSGKNIIVIDGGTGIAELGRHREKQNTGGFHYHIFLTHFHWDHLQGLPFFPGLTDARNTVTFYSPTPGIEALLREQMKQPFFPVPFSVFPAKVHFVQLMSQPLHIDDLEIRWKNVHHPGSCVSYRFARAGKTLVFSTDTELKPSDFEKNTENLDFYRGIDGLVLDAQYTLSEVLEKEDWGHSASSIAVDFALEFQVKTLYLFHHEPANTDAKIEEIGRLAQWYAQHKQPGALVVKLAREGAVEEIQ